MFFFCRLLHTHTHPSSAVRSINESLHPSRSHCKGRLTQPIQLSSSQQIKATTTTTKTTEPTTTKNKSTIVLQQFDYFPLGKLCLNFKNSLFHHSKYFFGKNGKFSRMEIIPKWLSNNNGFRWKWRREKKPGWASAEAAASAREKINERTGPLWQCALQQCVSVVRLSCRFASKILLSWPVVIYNGTSRINITFSSFAVFIHPKKYHFQHHRHLFYNSMRWNFLLVGGNNRHSASIKCNTKLHQYFHEIHH